MPACFDGGVLWFAEWREGQTNGMLPCWLQYDESSPSSPDGVKTPGLRPSIRLAIGCLMCSTGALAAPPWPGTPSIYDSPELIWGVGASWLQEVR